MSLQAVVFDKNDLVAAPWIRGLDFGDVPVSDDNLEAGDAWLATEDAFLIVERKTLNDLLQSIRDGRLFSQAAKMVKVSSWCYEVVTELPVVRSGFVFAGGRMTSWKWSSLQGALLTLQDVGVQTVWWPEGNRGYKDALMFLANRDRTGVKAKPPRREVVMESQAEHLLCALPGISDGRAGNLLEHCSNAAFALQFLTGNGGGSVPGIGPGTKSAVRQALGLDEDVVLSVVSREEAA